MTEVTVDQRAYQELSETMGVEFATELVDTFLEEAPNMIAQLKEAAAANDSEVYRRAAHSIKSNAETFGAIQLANQAREMELASQPDPTSSVAQIEELYAETERALRAMIND